MKQTSVLLMILGALLIGDLTYAQCPPGQDGVPILSPLYIRRRMNETGSLFAAANEADMVGYMRRNGICYPGYEYAIRNQVRGVYHRNYRGYYPAETGYQQPFLGGLYGGTAGYYGGGRFGQAMGIAHLGLGIYTSIESNRTQRQMIRMDHDLRRRGQEINYDLSVRELEIERDAYRTYPPPAEQYQDRGGYQQQPQLESEAVQYLVFTNKTGYSVELVYKTNTDQFTFQFGSDETRELAFPKGDYPFYAFALKDGGSVNCSLVQAKDGTINILLGGR